MDIVTKLYKFEDHYYDCSGSTSIFGDNGVQIFVEYSNPAYGNYYNNNLSIGYRSKLSFLMDDIIKFCEQQLNKQWSNYPDNKHNEEFLKSFNDLHADLKVLNEIKNFIFTPFTIGGKWTITNDLIKEKIQELLY